MRISDWSSDVCSSDLTSELFFTDMRVPVANRLGGEGEGFKMLMTKLSQERLTQAVRSICVCEAAIEWTVDYTSERKAFGGPMAAFQKTTFVQVGRASCREREWEYDEIQVVAV